MVSPPPIESQPKLHMDRKQIEVMSVQQPLNDDVSLVLVQIPEGDFMMGSPKDELERSDAEGPQRQVHVPEFWMGQYPVTQEEWSIVASYDKVNRDLEPDPPRFKGARLPVERASWDDAVEFCQRLSNYTKQSYRLPSEAEWEYACRAGTSGRYSFGANITWDQVNCRIEKTKTVDGILGIGRREVVEKEAREQTTAVGAFSANDFGLFDMHGNVLEWCLDHWHENYEGAPTDGSAWLENTPQSNNRRVIRGGSWNDFPGYCRSACRYHGSPEGRGNLIGFRVVLAPRSALPSRQG